MVSTKQFIDLAKTKIKGLSTSNYVTFPNIWIKVDQVMSRDVTTIAPHETVASAAIMMSEKNISCIVVVDAEKVVGILTETDLLKKTVIEVKDNRKITVAEIMSSPVQTGTSDMSLLEAGDFIAAKHIKRLPIVDDQKLVGIVTQTDLTKVITSYGMWRDISEIMSQDLATIQKDASVAEAAEIMASRNISSIIVMDADRIAGMLTERDLLKRVVSFNRNPDHTKTEEVMSTPVFSIPPNYSVFSASRTMENLNTRRLVVTDNDKVCGIVTQTDIFKAVKDKIQAEEETILKFMDESKIGFYMTNLDHIITYVNPAFVRLFDMCDPKEFINQEFLPERFWVDPEGRTPFLEEMGKEFIRSRELSLKTSTGRKIYIAMLSSYTIGIQGQVNGYQGIIYDITDRNELTALRKAEETQAELIKRIGKVNRELNDFAHIVSHDLKAPLRGIKMVADWITEDYADKLDEKGQEQLGLLSKQVNRMYSLIEGILKYSKAGHVNNQIEKINLDDFIPQIISMLPTPVNIDIIIDGKLPVIEYEKTQITQVFQNLLSNAIKYMDKPQGHIRIGCVEEEDNTWTFSITDNGPGIDKENHEKIFQIFQTLKSQDDIESTGIGLSLVKKIVETYGGTVWVESEPGQGSTFYFTVPKQNNNIDDEKLETCVIS
jgi:PAS domain S-box-containing protein